MGRVEQGTMVAGIGVFILGIALILNSGGEGTVAWVGLISTIIGAAVFNGVPSENQIVRSVLDTPRPVILLGVGFTAMIVARQGWGVLGDRFLFWGMGGIVFSVFISGVLRDIVGLKNT